MASFANWSENANANLSYLNDDANMKIIIEILNNDTNAILLSLKFLVKSLFRVDIFEWWRKHDLAVPS